MTHNTETKSSVKTNSVIIQKTDLVYSVWKALIRTVPEKRKENLSTNMKLDREITHHKMHK